MKNFLQKIGKIMMFGLGVLIWISFSMTAFAQGEDTEEETDFLEDISESLDTELLDVYIDEGISIARCIYKGNIDFILFLNSVIYSDGISEGVFQPFVDVFFRNQCHVNDVSSLIKQRDKIRAYIRDAFLSCKNDRIPELRRAYFELNAEIYYVRHVVNGSIVFALPFQILSTRMLEDEESLYYPREKLYGEMKERYVDSGEIEQIKFDVLFGNLEAKYAERKKQYVICESGSWETVKEKWQEFVDTAGGITPAVTSGAKRIAGRAEKIKEAVTEPGLSEWLLGIVQVNINGMSARHGFDRILEDLAYLTEFPDFTAPTLDLSLKALGREEYEFNRQLMYTTMQARFTALYQDVSDTNIESFVNELKVLNEVVLDTLDPMDRVLNCVEMMNSRQCPGN